MIPIEAKHYLDNQSYLHVGPSLVVAASRVLSDFDFVKWSGSGNPKHHHYGQGGLIVHTAEVIQFMFAIDSTANTKINPTSIFLAGLFHDYGKIWDYKKAERAEIIDGRAVQLGDWVKTEHARNIHHISRSAIEWSKFESYIPYVIFDEVLHAILAHHGCREHGSPVAPNTKLAWLLHLCDSLSARLDDCNKHDILQH